jgi:hypothetical protein
MFLYMLIQLTCWFPALFHFDILIHLYFDKKNKKKKGKLLAYFMTIYIEQELA